MRGETLVYCLTRDRDLAAALEARLDGALAFFYNDASRLHQAIMLRPPQQVVLDTSAIRPEYGDAGLGPVVAFVRDRVPGARIGVRPRPGTELLVAAEAGAGAEVLPSEIGACADAVALAAAH